MLTRRKRREKKLNEVKVEMRGQLLERSRMVKCLWVLLDIGLTWNDHIEYVRKKCFARLGKLKRWSGVLPSRTKKQVYNALVLPYLDYCSVVWQECSQCLRQKLERVQNYGMRIILSRPPRTHSDDLRKELNWTTLEARRNMNRLCLVYKCVRSQVPTTLSLRFEANKGRTKGAMRHYQRGANTNFFKKLRTQE